MMEVRKWSFSCLIFLYVTIHVYLIIRIAASKNNLSYLLTELYMPVLFSVSCLFFVFLICRKRTKPADDLILFLLASSLSLFTSGESGRGDTVAILIITISFQITAVSFLSFTCAVLIEKGWEARQYDRWLGAFTYATFLFVCFNMLNYFSGWMSEAMTNRLILAHFSLTIIFTLSLSIYQLVKKRKSIHKDFLTWLLFIPATAFLPFIMFYAVPDMMGIPLFPDDIAVFSLFALPIGYTYLLLNRQLFDLDFVINRFVYYSVLSIVPAFVLAALLCGVTEHFAELFFGALIVIAVSFLVKEQLDFSIRSRLFQDHNNVVQGIERLTDRLSSVMKISELENTFMAELVHMLTPSAVFITEVKDEEWSVRHTEGVGPFLLSEHQRLLMKTDDTRALLSHRQWLAIQLYERQEHRMYVWIGPKKNGMKWNISEKAWLLAAVPYVRLVADNVQMVEKKMEELEEQATRHSPGAMRLLFALSEKERRRLASDLHDSVLQEQFVLQRKIERLRQSEQLEEKLIQEIQTGMKEVTRQIRETCQELRPGLLQEEGLRGALEELFARFQLTAAAHLQYDVDLPADSRAEQDKELAVYRTVQELLHNAQKHSRASRLSLSIWEEDGTLFVDYLDNGVGFNIKQRNEGGNQMGVSGIKERVAMLSGHIEWFTSPQNGVQVQMTLPRWRE